MRRWTVEVAPNGRLVLPAQLRRQIGLERGGPVTLEFEDGELRLLTTRMRVDQAQALTREAFRGKPMPTVDDFLAWKREEAKRDEERLDAMAKRKPTDADPR